MILRELSSSCIILVQQCFAGWTNLSFSNTDSRFSTILCNHHRTCKCSYASKLFLPHPPSTLLSPFSPRGTRVLELWILLLLPNELPTPESSERSVNGGGRERREPWGESCVCTNSGAVVEKGFALRGRARANADRPPSHLLRECRW